MAKIAPPHQSMQANHAEVQAMHREQLQQQQQRNVAYTYRHIILAYMGLKPTKFDGSKDALDFLEEVEQYVTEFTRSSRFAPDLTADPVRVNSRFVEGLGPEFVSLTFDTGKPLVQLIDSARQMKVSLIRFKRTPDPSNIVPIRKRKRARHGSRASASDTGFGARPMSGVGSGAPICPTCNKRHYEVCHNVSGACFYCGQQDHFARDCPRQMPRGLMNTVAQPSYHQQRTTHQAASGYDQTGSTFTSQRGRGWWKSGQGFCIESLVGSGFQCYCASFANKLGVQLAYLKNPLSVAAPLVESVKVSIVYPSCPVSVQGRDLFVELILLKHYANVDCRKKTVTFNTPGIEPVSIQGDKKKSPMSIVSAIKGCHMLRKGCQGFLAIVRDMEKKYVELSDVPVVSEYPDVFPEELPGLPPDREIEFCIELAPGTKPISIPLYRMAPT
ncbi:uncharacterized protein LOC126681677 [Mercurialis annua]|uniref:uncharacterized protein LOC126681677 n=1 Tax=Mercurialis annua TaxID=3986 RepID=UPI00215FB96D|nr:uncharacterized protein LOC126681677 [Mercurialis annua]